MEVAALPGTANRSAAIDQLPEFHGPAWRLAVRVLGREEGAEDAVQQTYLAAVRRLPENLPPSELRAWFLGVAANTARMHARGEARRRRREAAVKPTQRSAPDPGPGKDLVGALRGALTELEEKYRLPVVLCCEEGLSKREAAAVLRIPESTTSKYVRVGLERLRESLRKAGHAAAPAAVTAGLAHTAPPVPAGLAATVEKIISAGAAAAARGSGIGAASAAAKGGLAMKAIAGIVAAGVVAGAAAVVTGPMRPVGPIASSPPAAPAAAEKATFTHGPEVKPQADGTVLISFAVSRPTDVEVGILDAVGKVINHLAAGALNGKYPPPEPLVPGLTQKLTWNRKDDFGNPVPGGGCKVRVKLGVRPKLAWTLSDKLEKNGEPTVDHSSPFAWGSLAIGQNPGPKSSPPGKITACPNKYLGLPVAGRRGGASNQDAVFSLYFKKEGNFYIAFNNSYPQHDSKDPKALGCIKSGYFTDTGDKIVGDFPHGFPKQTFSVYQRQVAAGDHVRFPGASYGGRLYVMPNIVFTDKDVLGPDPEVVDPKTDFIGAGHPLMWNAFAGYYRQGSALRSADELWLQTDPKFTWRRFNREGQEVGAVKMPGWGNKLFLHNDIFGHLPLAGDGGKALYFYSVEKASNPAVYRFGPDGKALPWEKTKQYYLREWPGHMGACRGLAQGPDGRIYYVTLFGSKETPNFKPNYDDNAVKIIKDGELEDPARVRIHANVGGLQVDLKGNIYVGALVKPRGEWLPPDLPSAPEGSKDSSGHARVLGQGWGCIFKFPPTGGSVLMSKDANATYMDTKGGSMIGKDVVWSYYGFSKITAKGKSGGCWCRGLYFGVDGWGRVFVPDQNQLRVVGLDTNRNVLWEFRNRDLPEVPMVPGNAYVTDNMLYLTEWAYSRTLAFELAAETSGVVDLPAAP